MNRTAYLMVWIDFATNCVTEVAVFSESMPTVVGREPGCWAELARFDTFTTYAPNEAAARKYLVRVLPHLAALMEDGP
jgi:hypothetical protein